MRKQQVRTAILIKRKSLRPAEKKKFEAKIRRRLYSNIAFKKARTILLYAAKDDEVATREIKAKCLRAGKIVLLPRVNGTNLELYRILDSKELVSGMFGVREPNINAKKWSDLATIDFAIIPGVAFDRKGHRIGYGKGYYDRLLKKIRCPIAGLAFDFQIVAEIPKANYDVAAHLVITDKKTYVCSATS